MSFVFRRMNATSQVGAQTSMAPGDAGTLVHVTNQAELGKFLMDDNFRQFSPFTILMEIGLFDETNAKVLRDNADRVSVLLTYRNESYWVEIQAQKLIFQFSTLKKPSTELLLSRFEMSWLWQKLLARLEPSWHWGNVGKLSIWHYLLQRSENYRLPTQFIRSV